MTAAISFGAPAVVGGPRSWHRRCAQLRTHRSDTFETVPAPDPLPAPEEERRAAVPRPLGEVLGALRLCTLVFTLRPMAPFRERAPFSPLVRAALGPPLRSLVCTTGAPQCTGCHRLDDCLFPPFFGVEDRAHAPRPYAMHARFDRSEAASIELTVFGRFSAHMPTLVDAIHTMARTGLGRKRVPFTIVRLDQREATRTQRLFDDNVGVIAQPSLPFMASELWQTDSVDDTQPLTVEFVTPTRIVEGGRAQESPSFAALVRRALDRARDLLLATERIDVGGDIVEWKKAAAAIRTERASVVRHRAERYSSRQDQRVPVVGVTGTVVFSGRWGQFWPVLRLAERVQVGKGAVQGQGVVRLG